MRKPIYIRILLFILLYLVIFIVIVAIQFPKQVNSSRQSESFFSFIPANFILPEGRSMQSFETALNHWLDRNYPVWEQAVREQNNEDYVIVLAAESLKRGSYRTALSAVNGTFLNGNTRTHGSSVYLGDLSAASLLLRSADQDLIYRLSGLIDSGSYDFLTVPNALDFLAVRGFADLFDNAAELMVSFNTGNLNLNLAAGIFEACVDFKTHRPAGNNPFESLLDPACNLISENLRLLPERLFVSSNDQLDIEFNLRLGSALLFLAAAYEDEDWLAIGRSLILSSLFLGEEFSEKDFIISMENEIIADPASAVISTAQLYRVLNPPAYNPKAINIENTAGNIWAWTAASEIVVSRNNNVLDISVPFPPGETHYMIIRGIRPFQRLQLYDMDYRSDPRYETYDSSGWLYNAVDETLLVKMRHRNEIESVRIYF